MRRGIWKTSRSYLRQHIVLIVRHGRWGCTDGDLWWSGVMWAVESYMCGGVARAVNGRPACFNASTHFLGTQKHVRMPHKSSSRTTTTTLSSALWCVGACLLPIKISSFPSQPHHTHIARHQRAPSTTKTPWAKHKPIAPSIHTAAHSDFLRRPCSSLAIAPSAFPTRTPLAPPSLVPPCARPRRASTSCSAL